MLCASTDEKGHGNRFVSNRKNVKSKKKIVFGGRGNFGGMSLPPKLMDGPPKERVSESRASANRFLFLFFFGDGIWCVIKDDRLSNSAVDARLLDARVMWRHGHQLTAFINVRRLSSTDLEQKKTKRYGLMKMRL